MESNNNNDILKNINNIEEELKRLEKEKEKLQNECKHQGDYYIDFDEMKSVIQYVICFEIISLCIIIIFYKIG